MPDTDTIVVFAVASPYAWDVVESALRRSLTVRTLDNHGGADADLPGPTTVGASADAPFVLGLASPAGRSAAALAAAQAGMNRPTELVDPTSVVASTTEVGHGAYVNAGAVLAAKTQLGCHSNVNRSASIGHHSRLGRFAHIGPGAVLAGGVDVGALAFVGAGATVLPERELGVGSVVGAGAVVTRDVPAGAVVVGNPATKVRTVSATTEVPPCPHCSTT